MLRAMENDVARMYGDNEGSVGARLVVSHHQWAAGSGTI